MERRINRMITYITTKDNPWNPFDNWEEWLRYDIEKGYNTCEKIDRLAPTSDVLPPTINQELLNEAMDRLIILGAYDKDGNFVEYTKVSNEPVSKPV